MRWNECSVLTKSLLSICNANSVANMFPICCPICSPISLFLHDSILNKKVLVNTHNITTHLIALPDCIT